MKRMGKAKGRKKTSVRQRKKIWCHYRQGWVPLGRARKHCPVCGAVIKEKGDAGHKLRTVKIGKR